MRTDKITVMGVPLKINPEQRSGISPFIGQTPLIELDAFNFPHQARIFAKLENTNPGGSIKDRVAQALLADAEQRGVLTPETIIIEPSSGNTGISLAMLCQQRGYKLKIVMPEDASAERRELLDLYGAEVIFSPAQQGSNGAIALAEELAEQPNHYLPYQYGNPANPQAHYQGTGVEILAQMPEVDAFVAGLGTGGTLMGVGRRLKEFNPKIIIAAAEPHPSDKIQGLRSLQHGFVPPILDLSLLDRKVLISNQQALQGTQQLLRQQGLFVGPSAGANFFLAQRLAQQGLAQRIVIIIPDDGWRYRSLGIYQQQAADDPELQNANWW